MPPMNFKFVDEPVKVYVQGRLIEESVCNGTCEYTYTDSETPTVDALDNSVVAVGSTVDVSGSGFNGIVELIFNEDVTVTGSITTSDSFTFEVPALPAGDY